MDKVIDIRLENALELFKSIGADTIDVIIAGPAVQYE